MLDSGRRPHADAICNGRWGREAIYILVHASVSRIYHVDVGNIKEG